MMSCDRSSAQAAAIAASKLDKGSAGQVLGGRWDGTAPWAMSVGERQAGVASVSAPVLDAAGAVIAAVSLSGPIDRLGRDPGVRFAAAVLEAGAAVSAALHR